MDDNQKIPGEKIASIEEYLPGDNTFEDNDSIRATTIGAVSYTHLTLPTILLV